VSSASAWSGDSSYRGTNNGSSYANLGAGYSNHRNYSIVGRDSSDLGHGSAEPQSEHTARSTLPLGPATGSAAKAAVVTDSRLPRPQPGPRYPFRPKMHDVKSRPLTTQNYASFDSWAAAGCYTDAPRTSALAFECGGQPVKLKVVEPSKAR
jgi:hypothetical protein